MSMRFLKGTVLCVIFIMIGANLYTPGAGFTFQNIVGAANILFFGCLALIGIYAGIKQLIKPNKTA